MNYLLIVLMFFLIIFIFNSVITMLLNKERCISENIKLGTISTLVLMPLITLIGGVLFLAFRLIMNLLDFGVTNYEVFIMTIFMMATILLCDFICKKVGLDLIAIYLSKKYKNTNLTNSEMIYLVDSKQKHVNIASVMIMFLFGLLSGGVILKVLKINISIKLIVAVALIVSITYKTFFKSNIGLRRKKIQK